MVFISYTYEMSVTIQLQNTKGEIIGRFPAEDFKSISQIAKKNNIDIPVSCCQWACYVCACKIKSWSEYIQIDKIMPPAILPEQDQQGNYKEVLTCVSWVKTEYLKDQENHEIILEKLL